MRAFTFTPPEPSVDGYPAEMSATIDPDFCPEDAPVENIRAAFGLTTEGKWAFQKLVDITGPRMRDFVVRQPDGSYTSDGIAGIDEPGHRGTTRVMTEKRPMKLVPVTEV